MIEKVTVIQVVRISPNLMQPKESLLFSQKPTTEPYSKSAEFSPHPFY